MHLECCAASVADVIVRPRPASKAAAVSANGQVAIRFFLYRARP